MYAKIRDDLPAHPKITPLSDAAFRLYIEMVCWCSLQMTGGQLPRDAISWDCPDAPHKAAARSKTAAELVAAGLWAEADGGWRFITDIDAEAIGTALAPVISIISRGGGAPTEESA